MIYKHLFTDCVNFISFRNDYGRFRDWRYNNGRRIAPHAAQYDERYKPERQQQIYIFALHVNASIYS